MLNLTALANGARLNTFTEKVKVLTSYLEKALAPVYIPNEHPDALAKIQATRDTFKIDGETNRNNTGSQAQYRLTESIIREARHSNKTRGEIKTRAAFSDFEKHWTMARLGVGTGEDS